MILTASTQLYGRSVLIFAFGELLSHKYSSRLEPQLSNKLLRSKLQFFSIVFSMATINECPLVGTQRDLG